MYDNKYLISNNDIVKLKLVPQEINLTFNGSNNKYLGKFFINKDGIFDFEGDCTESAKVFVRELKRMFNK
jgi:hypothetical protein